MPYARKPLHATRSNLLSFRSRARAKEKVVYGTSG